MAGTPPQESAYVRRLAIGAGIAALVALALTILWLGAHVLLLAFAGVLAGVLVASLTELTANATRLPYKWALGVVVLVIAMALAGVLLLAGTTIAAQTTELKEQLPRAFDHLKQQAAQYPLLVQLLNLDPPDVNGTASSGTAAATLPSTRDANGDIPSASARDVGVDAKPQAAGAGGAPATQIAGRAASALAPDDVGKSTASPAAGKGASGSVVSNALNATSISSIMSVLGGAVSSVVAVLVVSVVGIYVAATPRTYVSGLVRLIPLDHRQRAGETLAALGYTLRWWLVGQSITMLTIGTITAIGLKCLGVPLWALFGLLAGLCNFIPNFGALISFAPAVLIAWADDPHKALGVTVLYILAQTFEGYVLTPLVQRKAVHIPPALLIVTQVLMGTLAGMLGLMLATPLTAAGIVLVRMLYVEDALGERHAKKEDADLVREASAGQQTALEVGKDER